MDSAPDTSVKEVVNKLVDLQKIDVQIYDNRQLIKEKPLEIEKLQAEFEKEKAHLNELQDNLKAVQVRRKENELELGAKEADIAKLNTKLSDLKTNKEYQAMIKEIEGVKADKSLIEDKILDSFDETERITAQVEKEQQNVSGKEKEFISRKNEVETQLKNLEDHINVLKAERDQLTPDIDPKILSLYQRILDGREGRAIVPIVGGNSCGGCYMNVTPQQVNAVKICADIVYCENCNRMLYIEDVS